MLEVMIGSLMFCRWCEFGPASLSPDQDTSGRRIGRCILIRGCAAPCINHGDNIVLVHSGKPIQL